MFVQHVFIVTTIKALQRFFMTDFLKDIITYGEREIDSNVKGNT